MKKLLLALFLSASFAYEASAAVQAPRDQRGVVLDTIDWVGAIPCNIDASTGTVAVLCGSTGRNVVYGVIASSVVATSYLVFRDSATANTSTFIKATVFGSGSDSVTSGAATTQFFRFPVPLLFDNGISVNASFTPSASGRSMWTILYRPLTATE